MIMVMIWEGSISNMDEYINLDILTKTVDANKLVSQTRAPLAACHEPARKLWHLCNVLYAFEHKKQCLLIHAPFTGIVVFDTSLRAPNDFVEPNFLWYHYILYSSNICEILLYNRQWVVITHELICVVRAAYR